MKTIKADTIKETVAMLCKKANYQLRDDVVAALKNAFSIEKNAKAKKALAAIIENASVARKESLAICQDTGMPCVFIELGQDLRVSGDLKRAAHQGVAEGYKKGSLRNSIVLDPISRGVSGYAPAVIHIDIVPGDKLKLIVLPKGFGCENKTQLRMFNPTATIEEIKKFIVDMVKIAGPDACPPYVVGIGIGGTADYAVYMAKKALLRKVKIQKSKVNNLENELLREINKLKIGAMGFGGDTTALAVNIETYPTHIAGLPVAVNISCHALRSATVEL